MRIRWLPTVVFGLALTCDRDPAAPADPNASTGAPGGMGAAGGAGPQGGGGPQGGAGAQGGGPQGGAGALPPANAPLDYQLGGAYPPPAGVAVVVRDREAAPAPGLFNVCYVNGFQAQPQESDWWLDNHPTLVLRDGEGEPIVDPDWNELLLDVSTAEKRQAIAAIVTEWMAGCAAAGFDAVEIDNLDAYTRSDGLLVADDAVAMMKLLSASAHELALTIAQKNAAELLDRRAEMGTDFAIAEECNRWDECGDYVAAYGDRVFVIEYREEDFTLGCASFPDLSIVLRDLDLVTPTEAGYVYDAC